MLPPFSSNWTRRVVRLSTWPQLTSNGRWTTNDGRRATTVDISTAATMLSSFHQRPCLRSSTFLASIFFTIFTARAFWRLRSFLFFSFFFSLFLSCTAFYFAHCANLALLFPKANTARRKHNVNSGQARPKHRKGISPQSAIRACPYRCALSLSLSLSPLLTSRRCAIVCEYAKLKLAATGTL